MPDPASYFGITPPGSPLSQFFPQPDDDFRDQLEERPVNRTPIPREYQIASQLPDPEGFLRQVNQFKAQNQSENVIRGLQDLDYGSKDFSPSVAKLLSKNYLAAQNPAVQNILKLKALSGQQTKDKNLNSQAAQAMKQFYSLDPNSPTYPEDHQKWVEGLDPEVLADTRVDRLVQTGFNNANTQRAKKTAEQQDELRMRRAASEVFGIDPSDYKSSEDLRRAMSKAKNEGLQQKGVQEFFKSEPELRKQWVDASSEYFAPQEGPEWDDKKIAAAGKTSASEMTPQDWTRGQAIASSQVSRKFNSALMHLASMGVNPLGSRGRIPAESPVAGIPTTPQVAPQMPADIPPALQTPPQETPPIPLAATPLPPAVGFAGFQQKTQEAEVAKAAEAAALIQKQKDISLQWEKAKNEIATLIDPRLLKLNLVNSDKLVRQAGYKPDDVAFHDEFGKPVTWQHVANATLADPRIKGGATRQSDGPVQIHSQADWAALAPGTPYIDSYGKSGIKR